ncbi:hypothetical protein H6F96_17820 [Microcoleus sp. FACHB-53]|nr:hypothetical protein [Microcoleus sp. FACHB-53]
MLTLIMCQDVRNGYPLSETGVYGIRKLTEKRLLLGLIFQKNYRKNTVDLDNFI